MQLAFKSLNLCALDKLWLAVGIRGNRQQSRNWETATAVIHNLCYNPAREGEGNRCLVATAACMVAFTPESPEALPRNDHPELPHGAAEPGFAAGGGSGGDGGIAELWNKHGSTQQA